MYKIICKCVLSLSAKAAQGIFLQNFCDQQLWEQGDERDFWDDGDNFLFELNSPYTKINRVGLPAFGAIKLNTAHILQLDNVSYRRLPNVLRRARTSDA